MENLDTSTTSNEQKPYALSLNYDIQNFLYQAAKWSKLLAIIGFVVVLLLVAFAVALPFIVSYAREISPVSEKIPVSSISIGYFVIAFIAFIPSVFLYQFSTRIKSGLLSNNQTQLSKGFSSLKSFFKFWGILMLVLMIFYALLIGSIVAGGVNFLNNLRG